MEPAPALSATLEKARADPVRRFMRDLATVAIARARGARRRAVPPSPWGALAAVDNERLVGMFEQVRFVEALMRRIEGAGT